MLGMNLGLSLAYYLICAILLRCVVVYGYRIFLHPLHAYPGPFVAKFTDWYGAYNALMRRLHLVTYQNHKTYGKVFRQGPNKLVFNTIQALHDIYNHDQLYKSHAYLVSQPKPDVYNLFNVLDKRLHRTKRQIIGQGVNERAMRQFEPSMMEHIDTFVQQLVKSCDTPDEAIVDMTVRCKHLGLDIIGQLGFGTALNTQVEQKNRFMVKGLETSNFRINTYIQFPLLKRIGMELLLYPFILTSQLWYYKMLRDLITARHAEGKHARKDLYSFVVDIKDPETGRGMRLRDIWSEAAFFVPAGGDTTSTAVTAIFFYLSRYPACYSRLADEIRTTFASASEICGGPKLTSCVYLRACIDETLRITPPICTTLWREYPQTTAQDRHTASSNGNDKPVIIDGHVIPRGTEVGVNIYAIHHNEDYFPEPYTYIPERWIPRSADGSNGSSSAATEEAEAARRMHDAFTPFSMGSRGCAGKAMAYLEMSLAVAKTLWYLDFERPADRKLDKVGEGVPGRTNGRHRPLEFQVKDQFSSVHLGPNLVFRKRAELWRELF